MTCADLIAQYEDNLSASISSGRGAVGSFSLTQHWPNAQAGHSSGWFHYLGHPVFSQPDLAVFVGHTNLTYDSVATGGR